MDVQLMKTVGQIAGLGGVAFGALILVFREVLRKNIFPMLAKAEAYRLLRLVVIATWSVAVVGIGAWAYGSSGVAGTVHQITSGESSPAISGVGGSVTITNPPPRK